MKTVTQGLRRGVKIEIVRAIHIAGHVIELEFSDGTERLVDFGPFLKRSRHPQMRAYLNASRFAKFELRDGEVMWNDYELCFPVADLYEGRIV